jgi:hypothetical protein
VTLHLVCDISGSMRDGGKPFIVRTLVMSVAQWVRLGYGRAEIGLCAWASEARRIPDWNIGDEFPAELLVCRGKTDAAALIRLLGDKPEGKVLLLTDGFWSRDDAKALERWKEACPPDTLRIVKIGADADPQLRGTDVFLAEDLFAALDGWLEGRTS